MSDTESNPSDRLFRLTILMDGDGNVRLEGHIGDLTLAYGAIELAKDALRLHHAKQNAPRIHRVPLMPPFGGHNGG